MLFLLALACTPEPEGRDADSDEPAPPVTMTVLGFNTESGESDYDVIAEEVVSTVEGEAVWGFSEVDGRTAAETLVAAAGSGFRYEMGTTGWSDRLVIAWDDAVLELTDVEELHEINVGDTARAPLVATMRHRETGLELLFMVNHLWRTEDASRHEQAELLNAWGAEQTLPVVAVGDYNFDWDVPSDGADYHDQGYDLMVEGGVWEWVKPDPLAKTQCSWSYDSVLDFTFVANAAKGWPATSDVLEVDRHYCDSQEDVRSDHIPVRATFTLP